MAGGLESVLELIRPLVDDSGGWDYCVIWKLTADPSRFLEWMGCCCSGAKDVGSVGKAVKLEVGAEVTGPFCPDGELKHPISTMACHALARLPSFMPMYPGVHGAVAISCKSSWFHSGGKNESGGSETQVLIPVVGGLVELYATKHVTEDDQLMECIMTHCNTVLYEMMMKEQGLDLSPLNDFQEFLAPPYPFSLVNGSPLSICMPLDEYPSLDMCYGPLSVDAGSASSSKVNYIDNFLKKDAISLADGNRPKSKTLLLERNVNYTDNLLKKAIPLAKSKKKPEGNRPKSKSLLLERKRRDKIQQRLFSLRALVPKISKMDKASIIGDAIDYIIELQNEKTKLEEELDQIGEEQKENLSSNLPPPDAAKTKIVETELEVIHIGINEYLIRLLYQQKKGGLVKLLETLNSLGLTVVDANITNFHGNVLNILRVEGNKGLPHRKLRDTLKKLLT